MLKGRDVQFGIQYIAAPYKVAAVAYVKCLERYDGQCSAESLLFSTPGISLEIASIITMAGSSPPVST